MDVEPSGRWHKGKNAANGIICLVASGPAVFGHGGSRLVYGLRLSWDSTDDGSTKIAILKDSPLQAAPKPSLHLTCSLTY